MSGKDNEALNRIAGKYLEKRKQVPRNQNCIDKVLAAVNTATEKLNTNQLAIKANLHVDSVNRAIREIKDDNLLKITVIGRSRYFESVKARAITVKA